MKRLFLQWATLILLFTGSGIQARGVHIAILVAVLGGFYPALSDAFKQRA